MANAALKSFELEEECTITSKGQTTIPKSIRDAMGIAEGDRVAFSMGSSGGVVMRRVAADHEDPVVEAFLGFLAQDIKNNPGNLKTLSPDLMKRIHELTDGVEVDEDAPIEGEVAI